MANLIFRRIFHPVGQGAFFTEQLFTLHDDKPVFNVVYDCGSKTTGIRERMENEIDNMFANKRPIDFLFLSHFDDDHINYVKYLRSQGYLVGSKVFIPLLFEEKILSVTAFQYNYNNLIDELIRDGIYIVKVKIDKGEISQQEYMFDNVPNEIESGVKLKYFKDKDIWYWIPFNLRYQEKIDEFKLKLNSNNIDFDKISEQSQGVLDNFNELKSIYQSTTKEKGEGYGTAINLNSLQMLSYPASPDYCTDYERITPCDKYFNDYYKWNKGYMKYKFQEKEKIYPGSCLYTGDTSSNSPFIWKTLMNKIDQYMKAHLVLFQIPHHGSKHSNDERIVDEDRIYATFTNFEPNYWQKIYDPNISLQFYLHQKPLILVTNDDTFKFEECWTLSF